MLPTVRATTEKKLDRVAEIQGHPLPPDKYSVNQKVGLLVNSWPGAVKGEYETWHGHAYDMKDRQGAWSMKKFPDETNATLEPVEGKRRATVDDDHVDNLKEIVADESPQMDVDGLTFDELLNAALESYNFFYSECGCGWKLDGDESGG